MNVENKKKREYMSDFEIRDVLQGIIPTFGLLRKKNKKIFP